MSIALNLMDGYEKFIAQRADGPFADQFIDPSPSLEHKVRFKEDSDYRTAFLQSIYVTMNVLGMLSDIAGEDEDQDPAKLTSIYVAYSSAVAGMDEHQKLACRKKIQDDLFNLDELKDEQEDDDEEGMRESYAHEAQMVRQLLKNF